MEILEAYDLTGSPRGAAASAGCDHKTMARLLAGGRRRVVGCRCGRVAGRWWIRSRRRSMSWWRDRVRGSGPKGRSGAYPDRTLTGWPDAALKARHAPTLGSSLDEVKLSGPDTVGCSLVRANGMAQTHRCRS